jgi:hypothetical protein
MLIGDSVTYDGLTHEIVGFTPTSVWPAQVQLKDPQTGATIWIDLRRLSAEARPQGAALRLVLPDHHQK